MSTKRVGIVGGTFNPIHMGHLMIGETAREMFMLDEIIYIPSGCSYMKPQEEILDRKIRFEMTSLAIADNKQFSVSKIEIDREGASYTSDTILMLLKECPFDEFFFIVGADTLFNMEKWKDPEIIFGKMTILAACRNGHETVELRNKIEELKQIYGGRIELLTTRNIDVSSTEIRERVKMGKSIKYLVPDSVIEYINKNQIYH